MAVASHIGFNNNGPRITATNYWETEYARRGYVYLSINAGCFRLLVPRQLTGVAADMRGSGHVVISMLPVPLWRDGAYAVEWLAEDGTDEPWSCELSPGQVDRGPRREDTEPTWTAAVYEYRTGAPEPALELEAHLRFVDALPCLRPLSETLAGATKGDA